MKKTETKSGPSSEKKTLRKDLESSIINDLKIIVATLGSGTDKLRKKITKEAGKLAKKLAKEITPHKKDNVTPVMDASKIATVKEEARAPKKAAPVKKKAEPAPAKATPKEKASK